MVSGSGQSLLVQAVILAGMLVVGIIVAGAVIVMTASFSIGPLVGVVLSAVIVLGVAWLVRYTRQSRRPPA